MEAPICFGECDQEAQDLFGGKGEVGSCFLVRGV